MPNLSAVLAGAALAMTVSAATALTVLELLPTGLSSVVNPTSRWALTPFAWGFRWFEVSLALAAFALAFSFLRALPRFRIGVVVVVVVVVLFALGRSFVGWVNMDAPGAPATVTGGIHWGLGIVSFISSIVAMFLTARSLRRNAQKGYLQHFSLVMGCITSAAIVLMFGASRSPEMAAFFGLFERAFYITTIIWIGTVRVTVFTLRLRASQSAQCPCVNNAVFTSRSSTPALTPVQYTHRHRGEVRVVASRIGMGKSTTLVRASDK